MLSSQGSEFTSPVQTLDEADQLWRGLCVEHDAACKEVSECLRATGSGSPESYMRLKQARRRAKTIEHVMLRFLDVVDRAHSTLKEMKAHVQ